MLIRGLLVAASGFIFIFSPGVPIGLLARRGQSFDRGLIYWGMGAWLLALPPSLFLQSLLRQIAQGEQAPARAAAPPAGYALTLVGALLTAFFVQAAMFLVLRWKRSELPDTVTTGVALGVGVGLISQIFTGLSLVGAGLRIIFGDTSTATLASLAASSYVELMIGLLPLILFRPALLVVGAARGLLVARAVSEGARAFWLAVTVDAAFIWLILALQLAIGGENAGQTLAGFVNPLASAVTSLYYIAAFALAYWWLLAQIAARPACAAQD